VDGSQHHPADPVATARQEAAVAEYGALRSEIHVRLQQQQLLITLTVTALAALGTVALQTESYQPLLVVPLATSTFGLMLLEHSRVIAAIGRYIANELGSLGRWETSAERHNVEAQQIVSLAWLPQGFLFVLCPLGAAIAAMASSENHGLKDWLAAGGILLAILYLAAARIANTAPPAAAEEQHV
jgi:hypothetical protein